MATMNQPDIAGPGAQSEVQRAALAAGLEVLKDHDRARFLMACGVGKSFLELKLSEALLEASGAGPRRILVQVPTLQLVRQLRDAWAQSQGQGSAYASLCVCSDPSLKEGVLQDSGEDHIDLSAEELAELGIDAAHTSAAGDIERINRWLDSRESGPEGEANATSVLFTTYHSAPVVGMAMAARREDDRAIDIGIFDEAHKTAGPAGKAFGYALADANLQIGKRLFFTATERVRGAGDDEDDDNLVSMDDEAVYGPRAYTISFREAADRGIIVPYKILISVVNDQAIAAQELGERAVRGAGGERLDARATANLSALTRAMQTYGLKKAICFHRDVAKAKAFAHMPAHLAGIEGLTQLHVSGRQKSAERREQMRRYEQAQGPTLITNAKCLTEGVNVPATDIVAFMDPKRGAVDIVQAVGRAVRTSEGKEAGYVLLPLHVSVRAGEDPEEALERSAKDFKQIREVLQALAESDEGLKEEMRRVALGQGAGAKAGSAGEGQGFGDLPVILMTDGAGGVLEASALAAAVRTRVVEGLLSAWDLLFAALEDYKIEKGHCDVPRSHKTHLGLPLGKWLDRQRQAAKTADYPADRRARLEALGVRLGTTPIDGSFERHFAALEAFHKTEGHCDVPKDHETADGLKLGKWLAAQRQAAKSAAYPADRRARMEALGVAWSVQDAAFERHFAALKAFHKTEGHCDVPKDHETTDGLKLGRWIMELRRSVKRANYPVGRRERLAALGIAWVSKSSEAEASAALAPRPVDTFAERLDELRTFRKQHGHCNVPIDHGPLGVWCANQRWTVEQGLCPPDRLKQLMAIGLII